MKSTTIVVAVALAIGGSLSAQTADFYDPNAYRDVHLTFSQPNYWTLLMNNYQSQTEIPADMTVDGVTYPDVGVRFRGNTSFTQLPNNSEKRSFNIRTDSYVSGQDLYGYQNLNLNNGFHDPTFLREFLTYMICRWHGVAPRCNFVRVFLNGQYWGVYINVQQPNKDMMRQWFRSDDGNRYRGFPTTGSFQNGRCAMTWLGNNVNSYLNAYQPKEGDGTDLMQLCDVLNNTPTGQLQSLLPDIFSVDQFYRYAACMNIVTQTDSYIGSGKDHFLYHDNVHGAFHVFPFDVNEAFAGNTTLSPTYNTTNTSKPAFSETLPFSDWNARYLAHYRTIAEDSFTWATLGPIITLYHGMIEADVVADTKKIYSTQQFYNNVTATVNLGGLGGNNVPGLQPLIQGREAWLAGHPLLTAPRATLTNLQHTPANPSPNQTVTVTVDATSEASTVSLWRRSDGPFTKTPMFDDGQHGDGAAGDGTWGVMLPAMAPGLLLDYYAEASTNTGTLTFEPKTAELNAATILIEWPTGTSPVKLNEFVAKNNAVIADPAGEFEDYLELYNDSAQAMAIGGMYLTDDLTNPDKWDIPSGEIIPAFGTKLIWCDEDGSQGPLHANFKLSSGGEEVALFAADGVTLLDRFTFGLQLADVATGRLIDGGAPWVCLGQPSPDTPNELSGCGTRTFTALDPLTHVMTLSVSGAPQIGASPTVSVGNGPINVAASLFVSPDSGYLAVPGTDLTALIGLSSWFSLPLGLDATGGVTLPMVIPNSPSLVGMSFYLQAAAWDGLGFMYGSNALEAVICQ